MSIKDIKAWMQLLAHNVFDWLRAAGGCSAIQVVFLDLVHLLPDSVWTRLIFLIISLAGSFSPNEKYGWNSKLGIFKLETWFKLLKEWKLIT